MHIFQESFIFWHFKWYNHPERRKRFQSLVPFLSTFFYSLCIFFFFNQIPIFEIWMKKVLGVFLFQRKSFSGSLNILYQNLFWQMKFTIHHFPRIKSYQRNNILTQVKRGQWISTCDDEKCDFLLEWWINSSVRALNL